MDCIAIIPARFASTRFPGKLLAPLAGRPLIQHVASAVLRIPGIDATVVATDDERIAAASRRAGAEVVVSTDDYPSGTDRVAAVAEQYPAEVIVNVQGDELIVDPESFGAALRKFRAAGVDFGTLRAVLREADDFWDPNVVKVVVDAAGRALYFSRSAIPFPRRGWQAISGEAATVDAASGIELAGAGKATAGRAWAHVGVYFYRRDGLRRWAGLRASPLELEEGLEQLRILEAGEAIHTYVIADTIPGVNTPDDLERARVVLASR